MLLSSDYSNMPHPSALKNILTNLGTDVVGECEVQSKLSEDFTLKLKSKVFYQSLDDFSTVCDTLSADKNFCPTVGSYVAACISRTWQRGYILSVLDSDTFRVAVSDCCAVFTVNIDNIKQCPDKYLHIPVYGVRASLFGRKAAPDLRLIKCGTKFRFKIVSRCESSVIAFLKNRYICKDKIIQVTLSPWIPNFEDACLRCVKLKKKCNAQILSYMSQHDLYLCPLDDDNVDLRNSVIQDVAAYCQDVPNLEKLPDPGELVACQFTSDNIYYRAQVIHCKKKNVQVIYIDFGNIEYVTIDRLKPLSQSFKEIPCTAVHVSLQGVRHCPLTLSAINFLDYIIMTDSTLVVDFTNTYVNGVTLTSSNHENVNDIVNDLLKPKWKTNLESGMDPLVDTPLMVDEDINFVDFPENERFNIFILNKNVGNDFYGCIVDDLSMFILKSFPKEIAAYCETVPMDCYTPRVNELCLAMYGDEWLRAVCQKIGPFYCAIYFIDWGNVEIMSPHYIRKMPQYFAELPLLANRCKLGGLPETLSEPCLEVDKLISLYSIHTVHVTCKVGDIYVLDMH